jgi:DNA-binding NtrC family response regulator
MLEILLVDDEPLIRLSVGDALKSSGYQVTTAADGREALNALSRKVFDVVISDIRMPKVDGMTLFRHIRNESPSTAVLLITAYGEVSDAVSALKEGANDYLTKPFDTDELVLRVARIAESRDMQEQLAKARSQLASNKATQPIIGSSPSMKRMLDKIAAFADSEASVLIQGESGTGKELVARALHDLSPRSKGPFVAINCAAFPETLLDAELFGHERGAFTGASRRREGRFQAANSGTLFLDEVAEMPLPAQAKLLRVLQEKVVEPLGTNRSIPVDVRILSATNQSLQDRMSQGLFREDLYFRLNVLELTIPPLRERHGDLPLLVEHFLPQLAPEETPRVAARALRALAAYAFPGNVRELEHALHHAVVLARGNDIDIEHLPSTIVDSAKLEPEVSALSEPDCIEPLADAVGSFERTYLIRALRQAQGKRAKAANTLGISRKTLWDKMKNYSITDADLE